MAAKTFVVTGNNDGSFCALQDGVDFTAGTRTDGWTVAKLAAGNSSEYKNGIKQASGTFSLNSTTPKPGALGVDNAFKTPNPLTGIFDIGNWSLTFAVRATVASAQAGRMRVRVFKSANASGSGATELTGATLVGTTSVALSTSADASSVVTWSPGTTITLNNEYLFFVVAWEVTTASGSNTGDVLIRTGQVAAASRIITPNFTTANVYTDGGGQRLKLTPDGVDLFSFTPSVDYRTRILGISGLQSFWELKDSSLTDSLGGLTGTPVIPSGQSIAYAQPGLLAEPGSKSVRLQRSNVQIGNVYGFAGTANFTYECWVKFNSFGAAGYNQDLMAKYNYTSIVNQIEMYYSINPGPLLGGGRDAFGDAKIDPGAGFTVNTVHHVAMTYDGTTVKTYLDGFIIKSVSDSGSLSGDAAALFRIGGGYEPTQAFDGWISHAAVYNRALRSDEIYSNYLQGTYVPSITDAGTVNVGLVASSSELEVISDTAIQYLDLVTTGSEIIQVVEAATGTVTFTPASAEVRERADSGVGMVTLTSSAIEGKETTDAATEYLDLLPTVGDIAVFVDSGTETVVLGVSGVEGRDIADAATEVVALTPSGTDTYVVGGIAYSDAATVAIVSTPAVVEAREITDTGSISLVFSSTAIEVYATTGVDSAIATIQTVITGSELRVSNEANVVPVVLLGQGGEALASSDTSGAALVAIGISAESAQFADDGSVGLLNTIASAVSFQARDDSAVGLLTTLAGYEEHHAQDDGAVVITKHITSGEEFTSIDDGTVTAILNFIVEEHDPYFDEETPTVLFTPSSAESLISFPHTGVIDHFTDASAPRDVTAYNPLWSSPAIGTDSIPQTQTDGTVANTVGPGVSAYRNDVNVADCEVFATYTHHDSAHFSVLLGRVQNPGTGVSCYAMFTFSDNSSELWVYSGGSVVNFLGHVIIPLNDGDQFGMRITGNVIQRFVNGSQVGADIIDSTITGPGSIGFRLEANSSAKLDEFGGLAGAIYTEAATVPLNLVGSATEAKEVVDASTALVALTASSVVTYETTDAQTVPVAFAPNLVDVSTLTDANTSVFSFTPASQEITDTTDSGLAPVVFVPSGVEGALSAFFDAGTITVLFTASGIESLTGTNVLTDSNTANVLFTIGGLDEIPVDADVYRLVFTVSGRDTFTPLHNVMHVKMKNYSRRMVLESNGGLRVKSATRRIHVDDQ
jgi:hypothetical protein